VGAFQLIAKGLSRAKGHAVFARVDSRVSDASLPALLTAFQVYHAVVQ
jgi:hypothetical protein